MLRPLTALTAVLLLAGCDSNRAAEQELFEDEALFSAVAGITETEEEPYTVGARDASDWRIGPAYLNRVTLLQLPAPNPVRLGQAVSFLVDTQGLPGGLRLYVLLEDPDTGNVDLFPIADPNANQPGAQQPGFYPFSISARQIALGGVGLYRVVLLDGTSGIVTFGDIEVTN
ncbi:hypothetical protein [Rubrivirga marina]|uniref:Lipoprotein n=1 Tax=Rubrivirga marina TaxID=1196024 RepID=A0A271J045_9BACT|nr:hypothetical protein [Rubrivirga marina]PAP76833.1 hypothetical protein BSZ37_10515 [Rubrivirga marina]